MSGIYIHIPFCKQACHYCNFHFSTSLKYKERMFQNILEEIDFRQHYLSKKNISSIYFGGGTPSLLSPEEIQQILNKINTLFQVDRNAEITLEANPDDLNQNYLEAIKKAGINRLSIGVQSFYDDDLSYMNRAHNAAEAKNCITFALNAGFRDLSIDLIYGTPSLTDEKWIAQLEKVCEMPITHLSCYCLTVEPGTALDHFVKKGKSRPVDEQQAARQFELLTNMSEAKGWVHYEISNFARPDHFARHNSSYWKGEAYLGIGPSAHSYNQKSRQWNIAHNAKYMQAIESGKPSFELEELTLKDRYNEYVLTSLRTIWGCDLKEIQQLGDTFERWFLETVQVFIAQNHIMEKEGIYTLNRSGKLLADFITAELFYGE